MKSDRKVILLKAEGTYGTDAAPVGATDTIQAINFQWTKAGKAVTDEFDYDQPFYGSREKFVVSLVRECSFELPVIGGGTALGTPYPAGMLAAYRGCGMAQTIHAGVSVAINPISTGEEGVTLKAYEDGMLRSMVGARGSMRWEFNEDKVPRAFVNVIGLYSTPTDVSMVSPTFPTLSKPVGFTKTNTTLTLGGVAIKCSSIVIDEGRVNQYRNLANVEDIQPLDCKPTATLKFELPTVAQLPMYTHLESAAQLALAITHGTVAFNKFGFTASRASLVDLDDVKDRGIIHVTAKFELLPSSTGNDQYSILLT